MRIDPPEQWLLRSRLEVGGRIRSFRVDAGLTQERLAELIQVDRKTVSRIENGVHAMTIDQVHLIARALGVPPARLFTGE